MSIEKLRINPSHLKKCDVERAIEEYDELRDKYEELVISVGMAREILFRTLERLGIMLTKKELNFEKLEIKANGRDSYRVSRGLYLLGAISFYDVLDKHVFVPLPMTIYTSEDSKEISEFIDTL